MERQTLKMSLAEFLNYAQACDGIAMYTVPPSPLSCGHPPALVFAFVGPDAPRAAEKLKEVFRLAERRTDAGPLIVRP